MSLTGALGVASQIKNIDKIALYFFGFIAFIIILITLGIAGWKDALSMLLGWFLVVAAIPLIYFGKLNIQYAIAIMIFGGFLIIVEPGSSFTVQSLADPLGMGPSIILAPVISVMPKIEKKLSRGGEK